MTTYKTNEKRKLRKQQTKGNTIMYLVSGIANIKPKTTSRKVGKLELKHFHKAQLTTNYAND